MYSWINNEVLWGIFFKSKLAGSIGISHSENMLENPCMSNKKTSQAIYQETDVNFFYQKQISRVRIGNYILCNPVVLNYLYMAQILASASKVFK